MDCNNCPLKDRCFQTQTDKLVCEYNKGKDTNSKMQNLTI